ncbi:Replication factor C subunit 3 [Zea mays]|uniref:Replication factor C subunit 3 n=1 Tax=Zea mays TaxID=4577 RepID=A0A3L6E3B7_MAIZE|nr:Replication factor C subunit 3 [Zea mays]
MNLYYAYSGRHPWNCYFNNSALIVQSDPSTPLILVPVSSSSNHVELHMRFQSKNSRYALMTLANEMSDECKITEPVARKSFKVIVLYDVDKVSQNNQRLIKWIIDSSSNACKIIMTCQDESNLLDSIKSHCKIISIGVPSTREAMAPARTTEEWRDKTRREIHRAWRLHCIRMQSVGFLV